MSTAEQHYEHLLAKHYTWMFGASFEQKVSEQSSILAFALQHLTHRPSEPLAIDLGCGSGFQTIALAQLGFSPVLAVDTSQQLLDELGTHIGDLPAQIKNSDLQHLSQIARPESATVIVCMGDTLTHLPSKDAVVQLFCDVFRTLSPQGLFILTYRDLTPELSGVDRFIPVRSDENTIMTCFLEYKSPESVLVHDLIYTRQQNGWDLKKSSYPKLRLGLPWVTQELQAAGFTIESQETAARLQQIVAKKP